ncbi:DUF937 domain-containing protein [Pseudochryseolinea flava]|uniref:DUF937 domain-containing protein n=1 Tax=Pseudochryseolinea flava TaxID=2059302 RepID=A0A364XVX0_9BACT|nr:DUF937 domain-containing protein [Pseudochryseolinea flava]RAV98465.1 hypothetical protein DQQ10_23355 [Pseudochryseolinea flava]
MLDQLIKLVEQNAGKAIVQNDAVPNQHNNAAIKDVATQIFDGLKGQVSQGNIQDVVSMFKGGQQSSLTNNPMVTQLIAKVAGSLASKFGVSQQQAQSIAASLIPTVMNQFVNKTNNPNDNDFDLQDVMKNFTGNSNFDVGSILNSDKAKDMLGGLGKMFGG